MATKLKLYRAAVLLVKQNAVDLAVTDDSAFVNTLDLVYDDVLAFCLEAGDWNYATRTVAIEASEDEEPAFGFGFAVEKPDDYAGRVVAISANERFYPPLEQYHDEGGLEGHFHTDCDPLYLRYISNGNEYGLNLADWHPAFERYFEYELAWRIAPQLTNMGEDATDRFEKRKNKALHNAQAQDARNHGAQPLPQGRLVQSRGYPSSRSRWRW